MSNQTVAKILEFGEKKPKLEQSNAAVVRQDRYQLKDLRAFVNIDSVRYELINFSAFGFAISSQERMPGGLEIKGCKIMIEDFILQEIDAKKVREEELVTEGYCIAFEITSAPLSVEKLHLFPEIWRIIQQVELERQKISKVPAVFTARVFELKNLLQKLEQKIEALSASKTFLSRADLEEFQDTAITVTGRAIYQVWQGFHSELSLMLENQAEDVTKEAFVFFREQMKGLLYQSPFAQRCLTKPRGYAGDYEMMNLIYKQQDMGETLFGKCVERAFLDHAEPQAVRNRIEFLHEQILNLLHKHPVGRLRIMSVASGPAAEIQKLMEVLNQEDLDRLEVVLLDQDESSLKHAQRQVRQIGRKLGKKFDVTLFHQSIKLIISNGLEVDAFDLIYSAGLFDYFSDAVAHMAGKVLFNSVKKGGRLIIGNFDISTPNRFGMSLVFDWNLIYRSRADLERIFGFPGAAIQVQHEKNGINLFCVLTK